MLERANLAEFQAGVSLCNTRVMTLGNRTQGFSRRTVAVGG